MADEIDPPDETPDEPSATGAPPVPAIRFSEVSRERTKYKREVERLAPLEIKAADLQKQIEALTASKAEVETTHAATAAAWAEERQIIGSGLFDEPAEAIEVARPFWARLPEKDRPSFPDYMKGLTVESAPKALTSYIRRPDTKADPVRGLLPKVDNPGKPPPSTPIYTAEQMQTIRLTAQRTGDYTALRKMQEDLKAAKRT